MPCDEINRINAGQSKRNNIQIGKRAEDRAGGQCRAAAVRRRNQRRHSAAERNLCQRIHSSTLAKQPRSDIADSKKSVKSGARIPVCNRSFCPP